jgi:hypothetical protein
MVDRPLKLIRLSQLRSEVFRIQIVVLLPSGQIRME